MDKYDHKKVEPKWQEKWAKEGIYHTRDFSEKKKFYLLVEYPYPSGEGLHVGHAFTNVMGDILARYYRMNGREVLFPMGWDAFGLPTENSAIKLGVQPAVLTKKNTANFKGQNISLGMSFDWDREIDTSDPAYYRWTQWIFLQLFKADLAYKSGAKVGWCPKCKIILANEEIVAGKCERCGAEIEYRNQKQWILKITAYADRLADELDLVDYPDYVKKSQRDWIGRKEWIDIKYPIEGTDRKITVSTTRPDTNFGATFVVVAPEHEIIKPLINGDFKVSDDIIQNVTKYVELSKSKSELERISEGREKTGVATGLYAVNNLNGAKMPIFVTDFVLPTVGTGAVVGVPGHDKRDFEFAKKFDLPVVRVVMGKDGERDDITTLSQVQEEEGVIINSDFLDGLNIHEATKKVMDFLEEKGWGQRVTRYHLRDWIFSRQHYWGEPIPIIHCPKCGMVPVPESDLPVELPEVEKYEPTETGESPLAEINAWVNVACPACGEMAKRETDTMPNWAGSSWYYLRYTDPSCINGLADKSLMDYWLPVDTYIGGAEHTTLHLLYSRFWHKFLNDIKVVPGKEPYQQRCQHGVILGEDGSRMSKTRGNIINPIVIAEKFGADTLRLYLMFMGPYDSTMPWKTEGVEGMGRFMGRLWRLLTEKEVGNCDKDVSIKIHQTIKKVSKDIQDFKYNTAISALMILTNLLEEKGITRETKKTLCQLMAPFAPHLAEEVWVNTLGEPFSVHQSLWPKYDPEMVREEEVVIVVQINGKVRGQIKADVKVASDQTEVERIVKADQTISKWLEKVDIVKIIYIQGRILNLVTSEV